jgi:hypothetical protein
MNVVRLALLGLAAAISLASQMGPKSSSGPASPPPAPRSPQPPTPLPTTADDHDGRFWCHGLAAGQTQSSQSSLCFPGRGRCERERQIAANDGVQTSECAPAETQVACFQLGGDPNPSLSMCARTVEDCELWRQIDQDKNGAAPEQQPCALASQQAR